jgi:predicted DNA-binding protein (UPF0251 family)
VLTVNDLVATADFGLGLVTGGGDREVDHVLVLPSAEQTGARIGGRIEKALVVAGPGLPNGPDRLVRTLADGGAAGLALVGAAADDPRLGVLRATAAATGLPLLASPGTPAAWRELAPRVADLAADAVRRQHARLTGLLDRLPAPDTDERTTLTKLTSFLAAQLDAEVVVRTEEGVLASAPATALAALGPVLEPAAGSAAAPVTGRPPASAPGRPPGSAPGPAPGSAPGPASGSAPGSSARSRQPTVPGRFVQVLPLSGAGDATLVVATRQPPSPTDRGLAAYTAKALNLALAGLRERQAERAVGEAVRGVRLSAFQLLMTGNSVPAQRVMASLAGGLLDCETVQVFVLDCARAGREAVLAEAERTLADEALAVRCPAFDSHVIVVAPHHPHTRPEQGLHRVLDTFADARVLLGGSLAHPLDATADAYVEALDSLTRAGRSPDRIAMATRTTGIVDVLAPAPARAWASHLLHPVLTLPRGGRQVLETTAIAVEFEISAAARVMGVHRNTVARRVRQVFEAVGLDHERILDRVVFSLAAQIDGRHGADPGQDPATAPDLHTLLGEPALRAWADKTLRPLADDRRDLLRTVRAWIQHGCRFEAAALSLGIAAKTVRAHIRAAEPLLARDLTTGPPVDDVEAAGHRLASVRPLAVALYATAHDGSAARPPLPGGLA